MTTNWKAFHWHYCSFGEAELLATLLDLELRKLVTLAPKKHSGGVNFTIHASPGAEHQTLGFEQEVLLCVKVLKKDADWQQLKNDTRIWDGSIEHTLEHTLRQKGYFWHEGEGATTATFILVGLIAALGLIVAPAIISIGWTTTPLTGEFDELDRDISMFAVSVMATVGVLVYALAAHLGFSAYRRAMDMERGTKRLRMVWPHLEGYREYLRLVEQDRIKFANLEQKGHAHKKLMPYAIALNLKTNWEIRFKA